jgi:HD-GYP domain-containing protein (c-di-GMP phosphodiesterase class II)
MASRRISMSDLPVGKPLQWDVHDVDGGLLLRKGYVIPNADQAAELIARGMFADIDKLNSIAAREKNATVKHVENPSILRMINLARSDLRLVLVNILSEADVKAKLMAIAEQVIAAVELNADVAVGCILLNQESPYGARHSVDSALVAVIIARAMKKTHDEIVMICVAALAMNLSMSRPQDKLQDKVETLSSDEKQMIAHHPEESVKQLRNAGFDDEACLSWILHHHENENGTGYPSQKLAADIPLNAKIISVADRYTASVCNRHYRKPMLPNAAMRDILVSSKSTVEPSMAALLIRELGAYPVGTFVKLEDGEVGVVTGKGETAMTPCVYAVLNPRGVALTVAIKRETHKSTHAIREVLRRDQIAVKFSMRLLWGEIASL